MKVSFGVDASKVSNSAARTALLHAVEQVTPSAHFNFWGGQHSAKVTSVLVACDLSALISERDKVGVHKLIERSRVHHVGYCVVLNTPAELRHMSQFDAVVQATDGRVIAVEVKRVLDKSAVSKIEGFVCRLRPEALFEAKYSNGTLWLQFGDGKLCQLPWESLPFSRRSPRLLPETAVVREAGSVLQVLDEKDHEFDIDSESLRAICDPQTRDVIQGENRRVREHVGRIVQERRLAAGLTQEQLASRAGLDQAVISRIEQGRQRPRIDTLQKIASAMRLDVPGLLSTP